jgi:hypothetical protein
MIECNNSETRVQVKVNNTLMKSACLRFCPGMAGHRDVIVEDSSLGAFALHHGFDLLVRDQESSEWRPVELNELRCILEANRCLANSENERCTCDGAQRTPQESSDNRVENRPKLLRVGEATGLDTCVQRIQAALYRASIPHCRAASTFTIPSMQEAHKVLRRCGFCQHPQYESVLVDPESGIAVRLLERDPDVLNG